MKKIKNIFVPTDFSVTARNAFDYAERLAMALNADITAIHVHEELVPFSENIVTNLEKIENSTVADEMQTFLVDETDAPTLSKTKIKSKILRGGAPDQIVHLSKEKNTDLVVMGTTGLQDFMSKIIGSTSLEVANGAHCPVVLVPRDATWRPLRRILFASNYVSIKPEMVRRIADFAEIFGAALHFVHVGDKTKSESTDLSSVIFDELFSGLSPRIAFEIHTIYKDNAVVQLREYALKHEIDLVAFVSPHRSFWQNLMHRSVVEKFAISSDRPMLVMHLDDSTS